MDKILRELRGDSESRRAILVDFFYGGEHGAVLTPYLAEFIKCLFDDDAEIRLLAALLLFYAGDRSDPIADALRAGTTAADQASCIACHAALAALRLKGFSREILYDFLSGPEYQRELTPVVFQAVATVGECTESEQQILVESLRSSDSTRSLWASETLEALLGADSLPLFARETKSLSPTGRSRAFLRIAKSSASIAHLMSTLVLGLHDSDSDVRFWAILAIDRAATHADGEFLEADVLRLLEDPSEQVRVAAAHMGANLLPHRVEVVDALQLSLQSSSDAVRELALKGLGRLCHASRMALEQLFGCILAQKDISETANVLAEQGEWIVDEVIQRIIHGPQESRWDLLLIICIMGERAKSAKEILTKWLFNGQAKEWQEFHEIEDLLCSSLATMVETGEIH